MNVSFDQIICFVSLSKTLSFTESAILLGLTQPSVSRQIRNLESVLGVQLLVRNKHFVQLTSQGREFLQDIEPLMSAFENTVMRTTEKSKHLSGPITIGCLPEVGQHYFYKQFLAFQNKHPGIDLHVRYLLAHEMIELLRASEIDFAITTQPQVSENFRSYQIFEERAVLVTRFSNTAFEVVKNDSTKITSLPFVGYSRVDGLLNGFLKAGFAPADVSKVRTLSSASSHSSMIEALLSRDCFAVLPSFSVQALIERKKLKIVSKKDLRTPLYLVETEKIVPSRREKAFREFLLSLHRHVI